MGAEGDCSEGSSITKEGDRVIGREWALRSIASSLETTASTDRRSIHQPMHYIGHAPPQKECAYIRRGKELLEDISKMVG